MNQLLSVGSVLVSLVFVFSLSATAQAPKSALPPTDQRAGPPRTLNTPRAFPAIQSKAEWQTRAQAIREHLLVCCGLWPMPERTPLRARVFDKIEREGYSVEKVYLETYPGFFLAGNLYRPLGRGRGPFPAVLNPHGHWQNGRMVDTPLGSVAARCISFARQGMIAFCYDMVGYNDTAQVNHRFASAPTALLWNISLMGLQTWNSVRALDFLESLPDVDKTRLGCTGASGGGTQTFMLGAIDDRLAAQAPNVMVSHSMQGGCLCENAPGLRVDCSNMEIAATPAPRPQILVAATGDWTKTTMTLEGPAVRSVYRLFEAEDRLRFVRFDFDHNYNQTSREAVYEWFGRWLLRHPEPATLKEQPYQKEPDAALRVFPEGKGPAGALNEDQLIQALITGAQERLEALRPKDPPSFEQFKNVMVPAWRHTLQVEWVSEGLRVEPGEEKQQDGRRVSPFPFGREGRGDRLSALLLAPVASPARQCVVLIHPDGKRAFLNDAGEPVGLARQLVDRQCSVLLLDTFLTGELANPEAARARNPLTNFFSTYNRTDLQERVQDLITACALAKSLGSARKVTLCGQGQAGLWALLAAPAADAVAADCATLDLSGDAPLLEADLFVPGLRRLGGFVVAASLAAPHPVLLHNTGDNFPTEWLRDTYTALGKLNACRLKTGPLGDDALADWVAGLE